MRVLWSSILRLVWMMIPPSRPLLIRLLGGIVGTRCHFARTSTVYIPWNVRIGDKVEIGERVSVYSLGMVTIGNRVILEDKVHLCAGTHDMTDPSFPLLSPPITIGDDCFLGYDTYVGPDVTLGKRCLIHPRASVYANFPDDCELRGNPARLMEREDSSRVETTVAKAVPT